jgi:hypothetical protein
MSEALQFTALRNIRPQVWEEHRQGGAINVAVSQTMDRRIDALHALRPLLMKALERAGDTHSIQDVAQMILSGRAQFFGDERGACVTEFITYPRRKVLNIWLTVGTLDACLALQPEMEAFALANGATALSAVGRKGWERPLEKHGWRSIGLVLAKVLI